MRSTMDDMQGKHNILVQISQNHEIQIERLQSSFPNWKMFLTFFLNPTLPYFMHN